MTGEVGSLELGEGEAAHTILPDRICRPRPNTLTWPCLPRWGRAILSLRGRGVKKRLSGGERRERTKPLECVWRSPEGTKTPLWIDHGRAATRGGDPKRRRSRRTPYGHAVSSPGFRVPGSAVFPPPPAPGSAVSSLRFCGNPFPTPGYPPSPRLRRAGWLPATGYHKMRKATGT